MLTVLSAGANTLFAQKMNVEDILAKHLNSIGSVKNRDSVKTRIIVSDVEFLLQAQNPINGKFVMASSTEGAIFGINLEANNYRLDKFSYDGKKIRVGYITPGLRSILGGFILSYEDVLKEGLLGGTLSSSWALLKTEGKPKLTYGGTDKINGKETYVIEYSPKGGADIDIKIFLDKENFRHVRTEYNKVIAARMSGGGIDRSATQVETRYKVIEDFSNFKKFGVLTLPGSYKIEHSFGRGGLSTKAEWKFKVTDASFNQPLGDNAFDIDAN
jgi:hypothetical protein